MKHRIGLFFFLIIACNFICMAKADYAHLEATFISESPEELPADLVKTDFAGDTISVILIESPLPDLTFVGTVFGKVVKDTSGATNLYYVNITTGTRRLTVKHDSYHETYIRFPQPIEDKELWKVSVIGVEAQSAELVEITESDFKHPVNINVEPWAQFYIDEEPATGGEVLLEEGVHYLSTVKGDVKYEKKIRVDDKYQEVDAQIGGTLTIKSASKNNVPNVRPSRQGDPSPVLLSQNKRTYVFGNILGKYYVEGKSQSGFNRSETVKKDNVPIYSRSNTTLRFDEMIGHFVVLYQASTVQPLGFSLGYCRNFGWFASYSTDLKSSIETPFGKTDFTERESGKYNRSIESSDIDYSNTETKSIKNTSMTIHIGPMFRIYRKLYAQIGGGVAVYLQTSEPKVLTPDYENVVGGSVGGSLLFRLNWFIFGAGYTHQFVKRAYNPDIANQFTFTAGLAF